MAGQPLPAAKQQLGIECRRHGGEYLVRCRPLQHRAVRLTDRTPAIHVPIPERSAPPAARHSTLHGGLHLLVLAVCLMSRLVRFSDAFAVSMPDNATFDGGSQVDGMGLLISCDAGSVHSTSTIATTRSRQCFSLSPILHFGDHAQPADCAHVGHV